MLQPFSAPQKDEIFVLAKSLLDLVPAKSDQNDLRQDNSNIFDLANTSGCPPKKSKTIDDEFVHWQSDSSKKVPAMDEVQMYKQKVFNSFLPLGRDPYFQMLAVMVLSQHRVSTSKTVSPRIPAGARCTGHVGMMCSAVCSTAPHSQFDVGARPHLCMKD